MTYTVHTLIKVNPFNDANLNSHYVVTFTNLLTLKWPQQVNASFILKLRSQPQVFNIWRQVLKFRFKSNQSKPLLFQCLFRLLLLFQYPLLWVYRFLMLVIWVFWPHVQVHSKFIWLLLICFKLSRSTTKVLVWLHHFHFKNTVDIVAHIQQSCLLISSARL